MRKTKIICTLGPATDDEQVLRNIMLAGMNVARFNFSHGKRSSTPKARRSASAIFPIPKASSSSRATPSP